MAVLVAVGFYRAVEWLFCVALRCNGAQSKTFPGCPEHNRGRTGVKAAHTREVGTAGCGDGSVFQPSQVPGSAWAALPKCVEVSTKLAPRGGTIEFIQRNCINPGSTSGLYPKKTLNPVAIVLDGTHRPKM